MPSRSQRFGPKIGGWRTLAPAPPPPTVADLEARVYIVTFEYAPTKTRLQFPVLALSEDHAEQLGTIRLQNRDENDDATLTDIEPRSTDGMREAILRFEDADEWVHRQRQYADQQAEAGELR
jgi:hypothetical protein